MPNHRLESRLNSKPLPRPLPPLHRLGGDSPSTLISEGVPSLWEHEEWQAQLAGNGKTLTEGALAKLLDDLKPLHNFIISRTSRKAGFARKAALSKLMHMATKI